MRLGKKDKLIKLKWSVSCEHLSSPLETVLKDRAHSESPAGYNDRVLERP